MKKDLLVKIIIAVVILAGLGYFVYTNYVSKEKDMVFEARVKEVTVNDNVYTVLVEEYDNKKKEYNKDDMKEELAFDEIYKQESRKTCATLPTAGLIKIIKSLEEEK